MRGAAAVEGGQRRANVARDFFAFGNHLSS